MSEAFVSPLESNPEVLTEFLKSIGVHKYMLTDVYTLDDDYLNTLAKPVIAFILLFPCTENYEKHRSEEDEELKKSPPKTPDNLYYMRQYLHNACGTVALFHAVLNNMDHFDVKDGPLKAFYEKSKGMSPEERGKLLEQDQDIIKIHQQLASKGQTAEPDPKSEVLCHYAALVKIGDELFELDGRKNFPVVHGKTSDDSFLKDAAAVCKKFMARDEKELRFSFMAVVPADN